MGMILDYIEQAGKGKYQCFKTLLSRKSGQVGL